MSSEGRMVSMEDADKLVGNFVVLWKNEKRVPAKVMKVDKEKHEIFYEVVVGHEKGKKCRSRYDHRQRVNVFKPGEENLALLDA